LFYKHEVLKKADAARACAISQAIVCIADGKNFVMLTVSCVKQ